MWCGSLIIQKTIKEEPPGFIEEPAVFWQLI
jgi:hypothetical protein